MSPIASDAAALTAIIGYTSMVLARLPDRYKKYGVLVSCAIGVLYAFTVRPVHKTEVLRTLIDGTMTGLAASGGYAGMKSAATPTT